MIDLEILGTGSESIYHFDAAAKVTGKPNGGTIAATSRPINPITVAGIPENAIGNSLPSYPGSKVAFFVDPVIPEAGSIYSSLGRLERWPPPRPGLCLCRLHRMSPAGIGVGQWASQRDRGDDVLEELFPHGDSSSTEMGLKTRPR